MFNPDQLESFDSANTNMKLDKPTSGKVYNKRESQKKTIFKFLFTIGRIRDSQEKKRK